MAIVLQHNNHNNHPKPMTNNFNEKDKIDVVVDGSELSLDNEINPVLSTVMSPTGHKITIRTDDVDMAMELANETQGMVLDPLIEKKLLRKIDWMILPPIVALMSCQLMDKTTNSYASIMGLKTSLHMDSYQVS